MSDPAGEADVQPPTEVSWADPDTLPGLVQRGRGACLDRANADPAVAQEIVIGCIVRDPRWDLQVEERGWLYATLVTDLGIDLSRLRAAYTGPVDPTGDSEAWLAVGVLDCLAHRGVEGAVSELRHYLRSGRDLNLALDAVIPFVDHPESEGLLEELLAVADDDQLRCALPRCDRNGVLSTPPWPLWRRVSTRIDRVVTAAEKTWSETARHPYDRAARESADRRRILRAAAGSNLITPPTAADVPETHWEQLLLAVAPDLLTDDNHLSLKMTVRRCLRRLRSPRALAWARRNAALDTPAARSATTLYADLAAPSDAPRLLDFLAEATALGDTHIYNQYNLVTALARLNHTAAIPTIEQLYDTTVYSRLRTQTASALSTLAPSFPDERAIECLDDCESSTRAIAIHHANPALPQVRARLIHAIHDPSEDPDNRRAAAERSAQHH